MARIALPSRAKTLRIGEHVFWVDHRRLPYCLNGCGATRRTRRFPKTSYAIEMPCVKGRYFDRSHGNVPPQGRPKPLVPELDESEQETLVEDYMARYGRPRRPKP